MNIFYFTSVAYQSGVNDIPGEIWGLLAIFFGSAIVLSVLLKSPPFRALAAIFQALAVRIGGKAYLEQQRFEVEQKQRKLQIEIHGQEIKEAISQIKSQFLSKESNKRLASDTITLLFSDIEGWTPMTDKSDARAYSLLQEHHHIFRQAVNQHEGWEVKSYGDGFMIAFPSARKAILCALALQTNFFEFNVAQAEPVRVRIGINTGEPIQQGDDYIGRAVNLASRIQNEAAGGQILISEVVRNLAGSVQGVQYIDRGLFKLQGIEEKQRLYEVLAIQSLAPGPQGSLGTGES